MEITSRTGSAEEPYQHIRLLKPFQFPEYTLADTVFFKSPIIDMSPISRFLNALEVLCFYSPLSALTDLLLFQQCITLAPLESDGVIQHVSCLFTPWPSIAV